MISNNKVALVTGSWHGIGSGGYPMAAGYAVVLAGDRLRCSRWCAKPGTLPGSLRAVPVHRCEPAHKSVAAFFTDPDHVWRIDVLFNNAVSAAWDGFEDIGFEQWQNIVNINLTGSFLCAQAAADEEPAAAGRAHQQRLDLGACAQVQPAPYTDQTRHHGLTKSISDGRSTTLPCGQIDIGNAMTQLAARDG
jgi:NAD(P)-dependent dehydrogenase (short-subunit alcohol dehydrogenase family)